MKEIYAPAACFLMSDRQFSTGPGPLTPRGRGSSLPQLAGERVGVARRRGFVLRPLEPGVADVDRQKAHWTTFRLFKGVGVAQRRVVHGGGRSALATNRPTAAVGNPCTNNRADLTSGICTPMLQMTSVPLGDCLVRWLCESPGETRSAKGAGRPKRATGCSAKSAGE